MVVAGGSVVVVVVLPLTLVQEKLGAAAHSSVFPPQPRRPSLPPSLPESLTPCDIWINVSTFGPLGCLRSTPRPLLGQWLPLAKGSRSMAGQDFCFYWDSILSLRCLRCASLVGRSWRKQLTSIMLVVTSNHYGMELPIIKSKNEKV